MKHLHREGACHEDLEVFDTIEEPSGFEFEGQGRVVVDNNSITVRNPVEETLIVKGSQDEQMVNPSPQRLASATEHVLWVDIPMEEGSQSRGCF